MQIKVNSNITRDEPIWKYPYNNNDQTQIKWTYINNKAIIRKKITLIKN